MAAAPGTHTLGPDDGTVAVRTHRTGAAAKAGHDLLLHAGSWRGQVEVGEDGVPTGFVLEVDSASFRVVEGTGGIQALGDDDRASIVETIDDEILRRAAIAYRSTGIERTGESAFRVDGDLSVAGATQSLSVDVQLDGGALQASAVVTQSSFGIKPYSALFGALKVADEVAVQIDATLS